MGLTVSLPQTKLLVSGKCNEDDMQLIVIRRAPIEVISEFKYLGSVVEAQGETLKDVENRITRASSAFGALCRPVFQDSSLSIKTKRMVFRAVVLGVLLYGAEIWVTKRAAITNLVV